MKIVLIYNNDDQQYNVEYLEMYDLAKRVGQLIYGSHEISQKEELEYTKETTQELIEKGETHLGEGYWIAMKSEIPALCDWFVGRLKEQIAECEYEDKERAKYIKLYEQTKAAYDTLQGIVAGIVEDAVKAGRLKL